MAEYFVCCPDPCRVRLGLVSMVGPPLRPTLLRAIIYSSGVTGMFVPIMIVGYKVAPVKGKFVGDAPGPAIRSPLTGTRTPLMYTPVFCLGTILGLAKTNGTGGKIVLGTPGTPTKGPVGFTSTIGSAAPVPAFSAIAAPYRHVVGTGVPPIGVGGYVPVPFSDILALNEEALHIMPSGMIAIKLLSLS